MTPPSANERKRSRLRCSFMVADCSLRGVLICTLGGLVLDVCVRVEAPIGFVEARTGAMP